MRALRWLLLALAAAFAACGGGPYAYVPAVNTSATVAGRPASYYAIPPEAPRGDLRVATFGFADVSPASDSSVRLRAIHIRMIVANNAQQPWAVDTREQRLSLPGSGESRPAYATSDAGTPPLVAIPPGQARTLDLFYPLPARYQDAEHLPAFDVISSVRTNVGPIAERTPFERLEIEPAYYDGYYGPYAWGPPYWYDPYYYPGYAFGGVHFTYVHPIVIHPHGGGHRPGGPGHGGHHR